MYSISKEVHFCYGHRLLNHQGPCRYVHGHSAQALIRLEAESLDALGMICDFADVGHFVKTWIEQEIDHTLLLHKDDALLPVLQQAGEHCHALAFNPTAENIARMIFEAVLQAGFPVTEVTLYETQSAFATYKA